MNIAQHRPAPVWLTDLQKAKAEGMTGAKPKVTIQDLLERVNDPNAPESALIPSSPRSVEACFRLGLDPVELQFHPISNYKRTGEDDDCSRVRFDRCEAVRQERIKALIDERKQLVDSGWTGENALTAPKKLSREDSSKRAGGSAMVEKERQRLEVLKRKQERELQQMVQYEVTRKELLDRQQRKVDEMERRAAELARQKAENDAQWMAKQRELELQKMREEKELEREAKRLAEERYAREREQQKKEQEEERRRKREAYMNEVARRQKADEARRETMAILEQQVEEVRQKRMEMEKRDTERAKRLALEAKERAIQNEVKRKKAELRISSALERDAALTRRKRDLFEQRERENEMRRKELEEIRRREEERKREEELRKERERQEKYSAAVQQEEMRKMAIKMKAEEKDKQLADLYAQRKKENDLRKVEKEFQLKLRLDKVDSIQKTSLYQRQQLLGKIMTDYDRTRELMRERAQLQDQRKMANMHASLQRQSMAQVMDNLKFSKNVERLAGPGGSVDINSLITRVRPATAMT